MALNRKFPANDDSWKNTTQTCLDKLSTEDCDEYPFAGTEQGGRGANPPVDLKGVSSAENRLQGRKLGGSSSACTIQNGDPFLAIPVPPTMPLTATLRLCNK